MRLREKLVLFVAMVFGAWLLTTWSGNYLEEARRAESIRVIVKAYCPCKICCKQYADGFTSSGHEIQPGDVFVASYELPFNTLVNVPGYGNVPVLDRGPLFIEVFFDTHEQALEWGVKELNVTIVDVERR